MVVLRPCELLARGSSRLRYGWRVVAAATLIGITTIVALVILPRLGSAAESTALIEPSLPDSIELIEVPFFAQGDDQCGPAALAMVLGWSGLSVTPDALKEVAYVPARRGSLPNDLIGAVRRHGRLAYRIDSLSAVLEEVAAGHPVIVLQALGDEASPRWHYSVVVGYDRLAETLVLRSGTEARKVLSFATFEASWRAGDHWGLVVLDPAVLPATADEAGFIEAASGLEEARQAEAASRAYEAGLSRWPESLGVWVGLGNARYARHDLDGAERAFRAASEHHPNSGAVLNMSPVID